MKVFFYDALGVSGYSALCSGAYLNWGAGPAFMLGGTLAMLAAWVLARGARP